MVTKLTSMLVHMIRPYLYTRKLRHKMEMIFFYYFVYYWPNGHLVPFNVYNVRTSFKLLRIGLRNETVFVYMALLAH